MAIPDSWDLRPGRLVGGPALSSLRHVTSGAAYGRARARILEACAADDAERSVRRAILDALAGAVGFDAYAWVVTDPVTEVGAAPLAEVPCLAELPSLVRLKYLEPLNRWTRLSDRATTLVQATEGDLARSVLWRDLLRRFAVTDVASAVQRDRFGCWGFLDLWRTGRGPNFSEADVTFLRELAGPVTAALRSGQARTFTSHDPAPRLPPGPVVLLLSNGLEVRAQTAQTRRYLRLLVPPDPETAPVPAGAYNVGGALLAAEGGVDSHPPVARVHLAAGTWLTLRAARLDAATDPASDIAVSIERATPGERLTVFGRAAGLTGRETELLGHLVAGADTRDTAGRMFVSEYTVQDHLKSVFAKTGTHSRRTLIARVLGPQP